MSVALGIQWPDGRYEWGSGFSQATARHLASDAKSLGLPMLSQIDMNGWPQFGPESLEAIITEFVTLRDFETVDDPGFREPFDQVISELSALRGKTGWQGGFG